MAELSGVYDQDFRYLTKWRTPEEGEERLASLDALLAKGDADERYDTLRAWLVQVAGVEDAGEDPDGDRGGSDGAVDGDGDADPGVEPPPLPSDVGVGAPVADADAGGAGEPAE